MEGSGTPGGAVKCVDIGKNSNGEGSFLYCRLTLMRYESQGSDAVRHPRSPGCKSWALALGNYIARDEANATSAPPGEYGRKAENQGTCGDLHNRRRVWFNATSSAEPYQGYLQEQAGGNVGPLGGRCFLWVLSGT